MAYKMDKQINFSVTSTPERWKSTPQQDGAKKSVSCDMCRNRKIKCDKNDPCNQCQSSFHDCIYSEPVRKKRKTASSERIAFLESKIKAMEASTLSHTAPSSTQGRSSLNTETGNGSSREQQGQLSPSVSKDVPIAADPYARLYHSVNKGDIEFQGFSADRTFIMGIKRQLGYWEDDMEYKRLPNAPVPSLFDTSSRVPPVDVCLPPRTTATRLVEAALDGQLIFSVVHRPSFHSSFNLVYSLDESDYSTHERRFLPLLYAVMAYGTLFADMEEAGGDQEMLSLGYQYYDKSKQLQDIADCKDLISLQAIFFKISFLLVTSRVFTCYTYTSTALSLALRMGLHRSFANSPDLILCETGKRLFWTLWTLGNDVAVTCGLPMVFDRAAVDQGFPIETNDIYIEQQHISPQPQSDVCYVAGSNIYRRLHAIIQDVTSQIYAEKRFIRAQEGGGMSYTVSLEALKDMEHRYRGWILELPAHFTLGKHFESHQVITVQFTLAILYSHAQLYLYRPFLQHFMKSAGGAGIPPYPDASWLATICVQACENIIMLCEDMFRRGLLKGGNWLASRALLSSTHTLFYIILTSSGMRPYRSLSRCLALGRKVSDHVAKRNVPAHRWKVMMTVMIATLPSSVRHIQERFLELENKLPELVPFEVEGKQPSNSYTSSLAQQALNLLGSDSATADKLRWLAPHLLDALGYDPSENHGSLSPSWRMIPKPQPVANNNLESPIGTLQLDGIEDYLLNDDGESELNAESLEMSGMIGEMGFGDIDEFFKLQNWL